MPPGAQAEARAAFMMRLRRSGVRSLPVLRAMEATPRSVFVADRYAAYAMRDIALPIGCGQSMLRPSLVARSLEALGCQEGHTVFEIGSGSGYVTALLAAMSGRVQGVERFRTLAEGASRRLGELGSSNASVAWADGFDAVAPAAFDRIILHLAVLTPPPVVLDRLSPGGVIVYARGAGEGQTLVRAVMLPDGSLDEEPIAPARLSPPVFGRSRTL